MMSRSIRRTVTGVAAVAASLLFVSAADAKVLSVAEPKLDSARRSAQVSYTVDPHDGVGWHRSHLSLLAYTKKGRICAKQTHSMNYERTNEHKSSKEFRLGKKMRRCLSGLTRKQIDNRLDAQFTYQRDKDKDGAYEISELASSDGMKPRCAKIRRRVDLRGCNLRGHHIPSADLREANLRGVKLHGAHLAKDGEWGGSIIAPSCAPNCEGAYLPHADLSYANLSYVDLSYANLTYANLNYVDLSHANLSHANLVSDIDDVDEYAGDLSHADLSYADLSYADLTNDYLNNANLTNTNLTNTNLTNVDLNNATNCDTVIGATITCPSDGSPPDQRRPDQRHQLRHSDRSDDHLPE